MRVDERTYVHLASTADIRLVSRGDESDSIMPLKDGSPEDYQAAAVRHYEDATMLRDAGRLDNAGHLIGFSAECAIKHRIDALGSGDRSPAQHLPEILVAARKRLGERSNFASMFNLLKSGISRTGRSTTATPRPGRPPLSS